MLDQQQKRVCLKERQLKERRASTFWWGASGRFQIENVEGIVSYNQMENVRHPANYFELTSALTSRNAHLHLDRWM